MQAASMQAADSRAATAAAGESQAAAAAAGESQAAGHSSRPQQRVAGHCGAFTNALSSSWQQLTCARPSTTAKRTFPMAPPNTKVATKAR